MALNSRQEKFAQEYWATGNGTQSAINAGYSEKTASAQATRLLKNVKVQEKIKEHEIASRDLLQQQFSRDALLARKIMLNIMNDESAPENVRLSAAKDFLDRAGYKPTEKIEHDGNFEVVSNNPFTGLTTEELRKIVNEDG